MHPMKRRYVQDILKRLLEHCRFMSTEKDEPLLQLFNMSTSTTEGILTKIMIALPDRYFYNATPIMLSDILDFIVKNYLLFASQEDINSQVYVYDLMNFISSLSTEIDARYYHNELR